MGQHSHGLYSAEQIEDVLLRIPLEAFGIQLNHGVTRDCGLMYAREEVAKRVRHELARITPANLMIVAEMDLVRAQAADLQKQLDAARAK